MKIISALILSLVITSSLFANPDDILSPEKRYELEMATQRLGYASYIPRDINVVKMAISKINFTLVAGESLSPNDDKKITALAQLQELGNLVRTLSTLYSAKFQTNAKANDLFQEAVNIMPAKFQILESKEEEAHQFSPLILAAAEKIYEAFMLLQVKD